MTQLGAPNVLPTPTPNSHQLFRKIKTEHTMTKKLLLAALVSLMGVGSVTQASAAIVSASCTPAQADDLVPSDNCAVISDDSGSNINDSASVLNDVDGGAGLFDIVPWEFAYKVEAGGVVDDGFAVSLNATGVGTSSGTWEILDYNSDDAYVLVMKQDPQFFFAYLIGGLDASFYSGTWTTADTYDGKDLSHLSLYLVQGAGPGDNGEAPVPAPLALIGIGTVLLGALRRRARA